MFTAILLTVVLLTVFVLTVFVLTVVLLTVVLLTVVVLTHYETISCFHNRKVISGKVILKRPLVFIAYD